MPSRTKPAKGKESVASGFIEPALATLRAAPPTGAGWVHELKFDGYRLQPHIRRRGVRLLTRSGLDWTAKFEAMLATAFADTPVEEAIIDGELVAEIDESHSLGIYCCQLARKRALGDDQRIKLAEQIASDLVREAGSDAAGVD